MNIDKKTKKVALITLVIGFILGALFFSGSGTDINSSSERDYR